MPSREVSTRVTGLTAHENMDIPVGFFPPATRLTRVTLETWLETSFFTIWNLGVPFVSHQNLGTVTDIGKFLFGVL